jgi:hypothetical protein
MDNLNDVHSMTFAIYFGFANYFSVSDWLAPLVRVGESLFQKIYIQNISKKQFLQKINPYRVTK